MSRRARARWWCRLARPGGIRWAAARRRGHMPSARGPRGPAHRARGVARRVHFATIGWILPELHDPDGHEVRFYATTHHSEPPSDGVVRVDNPRETAEAAEHAMRQA